MSMTVPQQETEHVVKPQHRKRWWLLGMPLRWTIFTLICIASLWAGLRLGEWTFNVTEQIHFSSDNDRGYRWGYRAATQGYLNLYERMQNQKPGDWEFLDYSPMRLLVMRYWGQWVVEHYPNITEKGRQNTYEFFKPVLYFNSAMSAFGAVGIFLLTRFHVRRSYEAVERGPISRRIRRWLGKPDDHILLCARPMPPFAGNWQGLIAALSFWLNPCILLSTHGWPTWDMWVIPFFVWATYLASAEMWLLAGFCIAVGTMFKGQQLFIAAIFIIWPLLLLQFGAIYRWICGFLLGMGLLASPWMVSYLPGGNLKAPRVLDWQALAWIVGIAGAAAVAAWLFHVASKPRPLLNFWKLSCLRIGLILLAAGALAAAILPPWFESGLANIWIGLAFGGVILAATATLRRWRFVVATVGGALGSALLLCMILFHGSDAWIRCSFLYGTEHWRGMVTGLTSNLPGIMQQSYGWRNVDDTIFTIPTRFFGFWPQVSYPMTISVMSRTLFVVTFSLCCVGAAFHWRRKDPRFLVALTGAWLMFFCFPTQIHERYLIFAAGVGMTAIAAGLGYYLLGLFMSAVTFIMTLHVMLSATNRGYGLKSVFGPEFGPGLYKFVSRTHPGIGWAVLLCAAVFLYVSLTPGRRRGNAEVLRLTQQGV